MVTVWKTTAVGVIALGALGLAACGPTEAVQAGKTVQGATVTKAVPGPTVTVTKPGPTVTKAVPGPTVTVTEPGPTVHATVTVTAQPPVLLSETFNGSGQWNSSEFTLSCDTPAVLVRYQFTGNTDTLGTADNFIANLRSPAGDDESIANAIAGSGGSSTTVYPDARLTGSRQYYLSVIATGSWSFAISETC